MTDAKSSASDGNNRVALVTGATGNIGPAICQVLRREGWRVAACGSSEHSFALHDKIHYEPLSADGRFIADLSAGRDACRQLVRQIEQQLGPVALLVNNAVANPISTTLQDLTEEYCRMMLEVNLLAPLWLAQAVEHSLVAQRGSIISLSSVRVHKPAAGTLMYPAIKGAIEAMTTAMAMELGPKGVRVNAIRVGAVPGSGAMRDTLEKLPADKAKQLLAEILPKHVASSARRQSTTGQAGTPLDIAECVAFLASPRGAFFNAATLPLDGGFMLLTETTPGQHDAQWNIDKAVNQWLEREGIKP